MKLQQKGNSYKITKRKEFNGKLISSETLSECFEFAYEMSFGQGHHRVHRTGGNHNRKNGEIFANTFQGKLAEYCVYSEMLTHDINDIGKPDIGVYGEGVWDNTDLEYKELKINIKSAAHFSNLLLLETKDWNNKGEYIPNIEEGNSVYDYFILVRVSPDIKRILRNERLFFSNEIEKIKGIIFNEQWNYDIAGVASHETLKCIIKERYILPQGALLNGKTQMDAENYYIQAGDLRDFSELIKKLKEI